MRSSFAFLFPAVLASTIASSALAWEPNGTPICTAANFQTGAGILSDGAGGGIFVWQDLRSGNYDIYAQRVDALGSPQWAADGVALCTATGHQDLPVGIVSDGEGGAIVTWRDGRSGVENFYKDIYAQRIDASGSAQWAADGVVICDATDTQGDPQILSDGAGGAIVTWVDQRSGTLDVYAQRVDASGAPLWTVNGVALCTATGVQSVPTTVSDGAGGAIVAWQDLRGGSGTTDIYAQRVDGSGVSQWAADGVAICSATDVSYVPEIAPDGVGGAIITWDDNRGGANTNDIYAQRVDPAGVVQWATDGVPLCTATSYQTFPTILSDGAGGAIVTWSDHRSVDWDVYAQRVDASGVVQWTADGVAIAVVANDQWIPAIAQDGAGGTIITWQDKRTGINDIYCQRVDASGAPQWAANGIALVTLNGDNHNPVISSDGLGGAIVAWMDKRTDPDDIYALRITGDGMKPSSVGHAPSFVGASLSPNFPNPFSIETAMDLRLSAAGDVETRVLDVSGRALRRIGLLRMNAGLRRVTFDGLDDEGQPLPSGVYFYCVTANGATFAHRMVIAR